MRFEVESVGYMILRSLSCCGRGGLSCLADELLLRRIQELVSRKNDILYYNERI